MKSPLRKFRGFGLHHHREKGGHQPPPAKLDELVYAAQEVEDMRNCYDSLLSAAAATTNGVYEFSEALEEMGTCLLEKTALNDDDDDSSRVLMMLGKAQFKLQKLVDGYRTNIINTITNPSESLLKELQVVEERKQQCDQKREEYETMRAAYREKGRSRHSKIESFSSEELQTSFVEYQEDAALFIFRLKSLKQGQFLSILTQAARHHAAQLNFFKRGLKYLEALEPHIKAVAEKQHIDYQFSELEDDSDNDDYSSYQDNHSDDGGLSFDYETNDRDKDFLASRISMDLDQMDQTTPKALKEHEQEDVKQMKADFVPPQVKPEIVTQSAPIFAVNVLDPSERFRLMKPSSTRTFHSYELPTPDDDKNSTSTGTNISHNLDQPESKPHGRTNLWHSSPLVKDFKPGAMHSGPIKMPSSTEGITAPLVYSYSNSDFKKINREAFSGPIRSKVGSSKPLFPSTDHGSSMDYHRLTSAKSHGPAWKSQKISPLATISPKISELHELPRPPGNVEPLRPSGLVGYSGPLVSRRQMPSVPTRVSSTASHMASPLPRPPAAMARSYSIPSNSQRTPILTANKLLEARHSRESSEVSSPPLTPISLADVSHRSTAEIPTDNTRRKETL